MPSEKDTLGQALGRLGRVPPEVLNLSRQRIRGNLSADRRQTTALPLPDARPADLSGLRRPFYLGGSVLLCLCVVSGAFLWKAEKGPASTLEAKSAARPTSESRMAVQTPQPQSPIAPAPAAPAPVAPAPVAPTPVAPTPVAPAPVAPAVVQPRRPQPSFTVLPPGEGRVILDRACGACHRAAAVGFYHYATRAEYAETVSRMIAKGAQVSEEEFPVLTDYLFDNLAAKPGREADTGGRAILERACTSCHSLNGIEKYSYDSEDAYKELVSTMVAYGATLSEAEKTTLVRYLFATYGKR